MAEPIGQDRAVLWGQENGANTPMKPLGLGTSSATGKTQPGPGKTAVYGVDRFGSPVVIFTSKDAPGGLAEMTIGLYDQATVAYLAKRQADGIEVFNQIRIVKCGALDNPGVWDSVDHYANGLVGDISPGDGSVTPFTGDIIEDSYSVMYDYSYRIVRTNLAALNSAVQVDLNGIAAISDAIPDCGAGYPGPDQIMWVSADAAAAAVANLLYSTNGGGVWNTIAGAFAADENGGPVAIDWLDTDNYRVVVGNATSNAGNAGLAYADVELKDEANAAFVSVLDTSSTGAVGDIVSALAWVQSDRTYIATDTGKIYILSDVTDWSDDAVYSGAVQVNGFAANFAVDKVYAFGATNLILLESNQTGTFAAKVGPAGGGDFTAMAVLNNGAIIAGNGTSLYRSSNGAKNAGGWEVLKDFGVGYSVTSILKTGGSKSLGGDSQIFRVVVSNVAGGEVWETLDGGASFRRITVLPNLGYADAIGSKVDNNLATIVGPVDAGGDGVIHRLAP